jgi:N-acetylmuramoyl-L-alanine amidase
MAKRINFLGAPLLLLALFVGSAQAVEVRAVRLWAGAEGTRVIIDLSGRAQHSLMLLQNPDRVVLDVSGAHLAHGVRAAPAGAGAVKQVRMAQRPDGELRIVFDVARPIRAKSFLADHDPYPDAGRDYDHDIGTYHANGRDHEADSHHDSNTDNHGHGHGHGHGHDRERVHGYRLVIDLGGAAAADTPVKAEHARPEARDLVIAIDAGHGGLDPGAIGKYGTREKDVVLAIARALAQRVDGEPGMRARLTRDGDYFVPLRDRMRRARSMQADLFVSIHADSIRDRSVDGSSVYILSQRGATDEASRWLAERQNAADLIGGVSLDDKGDMLASVLLDLSQSAALNASQTAAEHVLQHLNQVGEIRKPQVQQARFVVLKSPDIPSMLVETAYISNPQEELRLRGATHQAKLAAAIHQGLRAYFYADPPAGSRIAELAGLAAPRAEVATPAGGAGD